MSAAPEANGLAAKLGQNGASAIEAMERMNADASALHIWLRTQANAPAQKAWFKETALDTAGQKAQGRVGGAQMKAVPHHWRWAEISPYLERISRLAAESSISPIAFVDRQQFLLTNPALGGRLQVANTLRCAVSIYNQGDCAPVHMHSPNASRTILSSNGGYTIVEGERCEAGRGDLILTPHGTWHDHGNDQPQPVMWMDVLDWPLLEFLDCIWLDDGFTGEKAANGRTQATRFADGHSQALYGAGGMMPTFAPAVPGIGRQTSPLIHYRGTDIRDTLSGLRGHDGDPHEGASLRFTNPVTGASVFPTMDYGAQLLRPGEQTLFKRETSSVLYVVLEGEGETEVAGRTFRWAENDIFVVPNFLWRRHRNVTRNDAVLYSVSDRALMERIGQYRAQGHDASGRVVELA